MQKQRDFALNIT